MSSIRLTALTKRYGALTVVDHVSFAGERGEFVTLLGPSGCGKTTTLRMIAGFIVPTSGRIEIGDRDATQVPPNRRDVALVFQNYALFPHMTVSANVAFGLRMRGIGRDERNTRVAQALEMVKLRGFEDRFPKALSGGQQQRVALARALANHPRLVLADEPTGNLDAKRAQESIDLLLEVCRESGAALLLVSHDAHVLARFANVRDLADVNRAAAQVRSA
jgi:putative spermidine/putrescine transport system ATP-binding protein